MSDCIFSLRGKTILVTGASSGIGRATAVECSKMGASMVITGRNKERLEETFGMLEGSGHTQIVADLSDEKGLDIIVSLSPCLDGVVNCAGINNNLPFQFATKEKIEALMAVNFSSPFELTRLLLKKKKIQKQASLVFISSVSGVYCSAPASAMYSASKGAINGMVKGLALDVAAKGIRVNAVCPGVVETHIFDEGTISLEQLEENKKHYPLRRFGQPEEVAYAVIYLLSDATRWITGTNIKIDGGLTLM